MLSGVCSCPLPCWWGITPGRTQWDEAAEWLESIHVELVEGAHGNTTYEGVRIEVQGYLVDAPFSSSLGSGGFVISVHDKLVHSILITPETTRYRYRLAQLLQEYGVPTQVLVRTHSSTPDGSHPFILALYYEPHSFLAIFTAEGVLTGEIIRACFPSVAPRIRSWPSGTALSGAWLQEAILGADPRLLALPVEDALGISTDDFYAQFMAERPDMCLTTRAALW